MYKQCALSNVPKAYITMLYVAWCAKYVAIEVASYLQKKVGDTTALLQERGPSENPDKGSVI